MQGGHLFVFIFHDRFPQLLFRVPYKAWQVLVHDLPVALMVGAHAKDDAGFGNMYMVGKGQFGMVNAAQQELLVLQQAMQFFFHAVRVDGARNNNRHKPKKKSAPSCTTHQINNTLCIWMNGLEKKQKNNKGLFASTRPR
jgi:hypothetical protein